MTSGGTRTMTIVGSAGLALLVLSAITRAWAQDKFQVTDAERAACEGDAVKLCSDSYPDQDAMLACMRLNQARLSASCRSVFLDGLHRRGLR